jgi:hypothetical protein
VEDGAANRDGVAGVAEDEVVAGAGKVAAEAEEVTEETVGAETGTGAGDEKDRANALTVLEVSPFTG